MISIIIRTRNEERWIVHCLRRVQEQTRKDLEVVLVDNGSADKTVERARAVCPDLKLVAIDEFRPGLALNEGIRASEGELIGCLSGHCVPVNGDWLESLARNFEDARVAGVYGRQVPVQFSTALDKRDLLVTFGLDRRVQTRDYFFHNANSMIRRDVWEAAPFDEAVTNIEDRVWAKAVIDSGYQLVYDPDAAVYHHHGIHQANARERSENVVRIIEDLELRRAEESPTPFDARSLEVAALIPAQSASTDSAELDEALLRETILAAREAEYVDRVVVSTDSEALAEYARACGADVPSLRPGRLSEPGVRVDEVLRYSLEEMLEAAGYYPDLVAALEVNYPFRPPALLDRLIEHLLEDGLDTVIAGSPESRPAWVRREDGFVQLTEYTKQRPEREPLHIGLPSLGCVTYPEVIRTGTRLGARTGVYEIADPLAALEIRSGAAFEQIARRLGLLAGTPGGAHPGEAISKGSNA